MKTRGSDFIEALTAEINSLTESSRDYDMLIRLESAISLVELREILASLKEELSACDEVIKADHVKPLLDFLQERWIAIQNTDAIYPHSAGTLINRMCRIIARHLSPIVKKHPYDLLMPTVRFTNYNLKLSEFILRDDGVTPLEVVQGFAFLDDNNAARLEESYMMRRESPVRDSRIRLSLGEVVRILNHSVDAPGFYKAIYASKNTKEEDKFKSAIKSDDYKVTASYAVEGERCLINSILRRVKTPDDLAGFLSRHLVREGGWQAFLDRLCKLSPDTLFRIMVGMRETDIDALRKKHSSNEEFHKALQPLADSLLQNTLKNIAITNYNEQHVRALLVCLVRTYREIRKDGPDYTSYYGHAIGYRLLWSTTYSKAEKLAACDALINLLVSREPLENIKDHPDFKKHEGPLMHDKLGGITRILLDIGGKKAEEKSVLKTS